MKKTFRIGLLLCIMLLIAAMSLSVCAAASASVSCEDKVSAGESIIVTVSLSNADSLRGIAIVPSYDANVFELTGGSWLISGSISNFSASNGDGVIAFDKSTDASGNVLTFTLRVKNSAPLGKSSVGCSVTTQDSSFVNNSFSASTQVEIVCKHSFTKKDATDANLKSPASCTAKAEYYYTCEYCGAKGSEAFEYGEKTAHAYDKKNTSGDFLVSAPTCTKKAVYYYSCTCGAKGTETFEAGEMLTHAYENSAVQANLKSAADCENPAVYFKSCKNCGTKGTETFTSGKALGHTGGTATCTEKAVCTRCNKAYGEMLSHTYDKKKADSAFLKEAKTCTHGSIYYKSCVCGTKGEETFEADDKLPHTYNQKKTDGDYLKSKADCTKKAVYYYSCTCGAKGTETFEAGDALGHNYRTAWSSNAKEHWHECTRCGDKRDNAAHTPGAAATETTPQICTVCEYVIAPSVGHKHSFETKWSNDAKSHWHQCSGCADRKDESAHAFDNACDEECNICGYEREIDHKYDGAWKTNETRHWHECTVCGNRSVEGRHTPGAEATETTPQTCTVCGYVIKKALGHEHSFTSEWKSDENSHWHACSCGEKKDTAAHTPGEWITDKEAEAGAEGAKHRECTVCKAVVEKATIPAKESETTSGSETTGTTAITETTATTAETTQTTNTAETTAVTENTTQTTQTDGEDGGFFSGTQKIVIIVICAVAAAGIAVAIVVTIIKKKH